MRLVLRELEYSTKYGLGCYRRFNAKVEETLVAEQEKDRANDVASASPDSLLGSSEYWQSKHILPRVSRNALIVMLCSYVDAELLLIGEMWPCSEEQKEKLRGLRDRGELQDIQRAFRDIIGIELPSYFGNTDDKTSMSRFHRELRHAIAHAGGFVTGERIERYERQVRALGEAPDLCIEKRSGRIVLGQEFIPEMIRVIEEMFADLYARLYARADQLYAP